MNSAKNAADKDIDPLIVSLYTHWLRADAIKVRMLVDVPGGGWNAPNELEALGQQLSKGHALEVFYALLYAVVEGYHELKIEDATIEKLLDEADFEDQLRRFRNAVFHYQRQLIDKRLIDFLDTKDSETWTRQLHAEFRQFFERKLPIKETLESLREGNAKELVMALSQKR